MTRHERTACTEPGGSCPTSDPQLLGRTSETEGSAPRRRSRPSVPFASPPTCCRPGTRFDQSIVGRAAPCAKRALVIRWHVAPSGAVARPRRAGGSGAAGTREYRIDRWRSGYRPSELRVAVSSLGLHRPSGAVLPQGQTHRWISRIPQDAESIARIGGGLLRATSGSFRERQLHCTAAGAHVR